MSGSSLAHIGGGLAAHARGRTLAAAFNALSCDDALPESGALFVVGKELQAGGDQAGSWIGWAATAGRALIVVPPFDRLPCDLPARWEARRTESLAGGETTLGALLARERRHEIRGQLLPLERTAGQVVTAGWRKHPAAGLVVITALPVWSLTALDHGGVCSDWLTDLLGQAGEAPESVANDHEALPGPAERVPTRDEWTLLLHLCTGPFADEKAALNALSRSTIHTLPAECATAAMGGLTELRFAELGCLTPSGERALLDGPYAAYARALWRRA